MSNYKEYFENRTPSHWSENLIRWWHKRMLNVVSQLIPGMETLSILEIGAGHGFFANVCKRKGLTYYGCEMNNEQADVLKSQGYDVIPATIPPIPAGKSVQVIWMSHILEHAIDFREARDMLLAAHERLDPGGYIVIIAPDVTHWKGFFWSVDWSHGFPSSLNRVEQLLNETNFKISTACHHTLTVTQPFIAWFLSVLFQLFPQNFLDYVTEKLFKRHFYSSFLSLFGLRQILLIGQKEYDKSQ